MARSKEDIGKSAAKMYALTAIGALVSSDVLAHSIDFSGATSQGDDFSALAVVRFST